MKLKFAGSSHVGNRRTNNEDSFVLLPDHHLYVVADGMGGYSAGEVASRMAVEALADFFKQTEDDDEVTWPFREDEVLSYDENRLAVAIKLANRRIFERSRTDAQCRQMGTTIVGLLFHEDHVSVAHVGDSRIYLFREGALEQLTEDHSLLNDFRKMSPMTDEEVKNFPHKNVIVRALGMQDVVKVDMQTLTPEEGDIFLLCSDGLTGEVTDEDIGAILTGTEGNLEEATTRLIETACENGGRDNVTVVLVQVAGV